MTKKKPNGRRKTGPPEKYGLDWEAIKKKYADRRRLEGASEEQIAEEQGDPKEVVWGPNGPPGTAEKEKRRRGFPKNQERLIKVHELHDQGLNPADIARATGVTRATAVSDLAALNLTPHKGKGGARKKVSSL